MFYSSLSFIATLSFILVHALESLGVTLPTINYHGAFAYNYR